MYSEPQREILQVVVDNSPADPSDVREGLEKPMSRGYAHRVLRRAAENGHIEKSDGLFRVPDDSELPQLLAEREGETEPPSPDRARATVMRVLRESNEPLAPSDIVQHTDLSEHRVMKVLTAAANEGSVLEPRRGEYTDIGRHEGTNYTGGLCGDALPGTIETSYPNPSSSRTHSHEPDKDADVSSGTQSDVNIHNPNELVEDAEISPTEKVIQRYVEGEIGDIGLEEEMAEAVREEDDSEPIGGRGFESDVERILEKESA